MTARIDLAELEQALADYERGDPAPLEIDFSNAVSARAVAALPALIAAVREARRYRKGQWASKKAARLDAALSAFDFKEEA